MATGGDPVAHRRRAEPIKVNTDPGCPGAGMADRGTLSNWDLTPGKKVWFHGFSHIPKDRWEEIFGKNESGT